MTIHLHFMRPIQKALTAVLLRMQYTESLVVEHGYVRGEINATMFHLQVRLTCPAGTPDCACRVFPRP